MVHVKVRTKSFSKQISHQVYHGVSSKWIAAFGALMRLQLEARQSRHLEEVTEEIPANSFFDQRDLEVLIFDCIQQMSAHHGLVEIGGYFCNEQGVIRINKWLILPGEIGMHRMAKLMGKCAHTRHFIGIAHINERIGSLHTP